MDKTINFVARAAAILYRSSACPNCGNKRYKDLIQTQQGNWVTCTECKLRYDP